MIGLRNDRLQWWGWPTRQQWMFGTVLVVLVNLPFWLMQNRLFLLRAAFDLTLMLPLLLLLRGRMAITLFLLVLMWSFDLLVSQALAYHFISPRDFVAASRFLPEVRVSEFVTVENLLFVLPFIAVLGAVAWIARRCPGAARAMLPLCAVLVLVDWLNGSFVMSRHQTRWLPLNVAGSPIGVLAVGQRGLAPAPILPAMDQKSQQTVQDLVGWADQHPDGAMLIVLVESLGWPRDPALQQWLRSKLIDTAVRDQFSVHERILPFRGATTYGELRTLCGLEGSYARLDAALATRCLPAQLLTRGWTSVGLHGFSSSMFDREQWWPLLGLQEQRFGANLGAQGANWCSGAFRGICDDDLLRAAGRELNAPRRFVYALTLTSHLPVDAKPLPPDLRALCQQRSIVSDVCQLYAVLGRALSEVHAILITSKKRPTAVFIAGDHAPPFMKHGALESVVAGVVPSWTIITRAAPPAASAVR